MWQYRRCHSLWRTRHPGELKDMVTSPGGTTIEGCEALEKAGMRGAVIECINVSTEKSRSLELLSFYVDSCIGIIRQMRSYPQFPVDNSSFVGDKWNYFAKFVVTFSSSLSPSTV